MTTTTHTPTPWSVEPHAVYGTAIISKGGAVIAAIRPYENMTNRSEYPSVQCSVEQWSREDAAHIVACVNAHDALVAVLRRICDDIATISEASRIARAALRDAGLEVPE